MQRIEVNKNAQKKLWLNITQLRDQKLNISSLFTINFKAYEISWLKSKWANREKSNENGRQQSTKT